MFEAVRQRACDILSDSGVQQCTIQSVPLLPLEALSVSQVWGAKITAMQQHRTILHNKPVVLTARRDWVTCLYAGGATRGVYETSRCSAVSLDSAVGRLKGAHSSLIFDRCETRCSSHLAVQQDS